MNVLSVFMDTITVHQKPQGRSFFLPEASNFILFYFFVCSLMFLLHLCKRIKTNCVPGFALV